MGQRHKLQLTVKIAANMYHIRIIALNRKHCSSSRFRSGDGDFQRMKKNLQYYTQEYLTHHDSSGRTFSI